MVKPELQNAIRINHRGFLCDSAKRFVLTENKTQGDTFSVILTDDVKQITVYEGLLEKIIENNETYYVGDFSSVCKEGDYHIEAGGFKSRQFVIYDGAYDICKRFLLEYFTYQRCGHPLGWNGKCHLDDGYIKETGEHVDLSGGYHQSCDLRKSPGGVSIGVLYMIYAALKDKSQWGEILLPDEVKWACDYYCKTIQENGAMYNTLNDPFGWGGRVFYKSPAPSSAQWNVTSILATGSLFFKKINPSLSKKYLDKALLSYEFMTGEERPSGVYKHPDKFQLGMDPDYFYEQCVKGGTADLAYQISAAANLYRATGNNAFLNTIEELLPNVTSSLLEGDLSHVLVRKDNPQKTVTASCSYTWLGGGLHSLSDAYELLGDTGCLKNKIALACESIISLMNKTVWRVGKNTYSQADLDVPTGHVLPGEKQLTRKDTIKGLTMLGSSHKDGADIDCFYSSVNIFEPSVCCYLGIFLAKAAKLTGNKKYMDYAQLIVDDLLGGNSQDSSRIRGIGYNHALHHSYGQFFPSTPFIPGAVGVGYEDIDVYKTSSEYDMPCVGLAMHLLSEIQL